MWFRDACKEWHTYNDLRKGLQNEEQREKVALMILLMDSGEEYANDPEGRRLLAGAAAAINSSDAGCRDLISDGLIDHLDALYAEDEGMGWIISALEDTDLLGANPWEGASSTIVQKLGEDLAGQRADLLVELVKTAAAIQREMDAEFSAFDVVNRYELADCPGPTKAVKDPLADDAPSPRPVARTAPGSGDGVPEETSSGPAGGGTSDTSPEQYAGDVCFDISANTSWPITATDPSAAGGCGSNGTFAARLPACAGRAYEQAATACLDAITDEHIRAMNKSWEANGWEVTVGG